MRTQQNQILSNSYMTDNKAYSHCCPFLFTYFGQTASMQPFPQECTSFGPIKPHLGVLKALYIKKVMIIQLLQYAHFVALTQFTCLQVNFPFVGQYLHFILRLEKRHCLAGMALIRAGCHSGYKKHKGKAEQLGRDLKKT